MTRDELMKNFIKARAAFLTSNKAELAAYMDEQKAIAADISEAKLRAAYEGETIPNKVIHACRQFHAEQAVSHINLSDLPPRFFINEPYFADRKATKTRTAVIEAAKAFVGLGGSA